MRIRIKFSKHGAVKFIGHLDFMRYFQKAIRRAGIDVTYSSGFSPHQIMSFAAPLGVGHCTNGDYLDIEVNSHSGKEDMIKRLNEAMAVGVRVENIVALKENTGNAMASVAVASYTLEWKEGYEVPENLEEEVARFYAQPSIKVTKQTKKSTLELDLKPGIYECTGKENAISILVDASSSGNIKPALFLEAFYAFLGKEFHPLAIQITREETYMDIGENGKQKLVPLDAVGEDFS